MHLLFDFLIIFVLIFFFVRGKRKGFVLTLCGLAALLVAFVLASLLARYLSPIVAEAVSPQIETVIQSYIQEELPIEESQDTIYTALEGLGLYDQLIDHVQDTVSEGTDEIFSAIALTVAHSICYLVIFLVAFVLVLVGWYFLSHTINLVFKLPGLHFLNTWGGAILGMVQGCIFLFIFAWVMQYFGNVIPQSTVSQTYLLQFFMETNPAQLIAQLSTGRLS